MRGKLNNACGMDDIDRITPADAGKTFWRYSALSVSPDHPRGCGENFSFCVFVCPPHGSPPRMRGKPGQDEMSDTELRITPADAGKTDSSLWYFLVAQDHPRRCGENGTLDFGRRSA